jgi:leader peptidase (prepilin peptidase)/N-methyltransferase
MAVRKQSAPFAFGPYLAIAGFIALLWGQPLLQWYLG